MTSKEKKKEYFITKSRKKKNPTKCPDWYPSIEQRYIETFARKQKIEEELNEIRNELMSNLKMYGIRKIITSKTDVSIVKTYEGRRVDTERLKKDLPDIFFKYSNTYTMTEHLQVAVSKDNILND